MEFKQRLAIAIGAAKGRSNKNSNGAILELTRIDRDLNLELIVLTSAGLCHLHGLRPPLVHKNFKTANVLVDENFIAKVSDAGISRLLEKIEEAGPSQTSSVNVFRDPE